MSDTDPHTQDSSVTVVISRRVKPGCESEFEAFLQGLTSSPRLEAGGFLLQPADLSKPIA